MAEQQDPAQQEIDRLAKGEATKQPGKDQEIGDEEAGSGQVSAETAQADDLSEADRRGMPGYQ
jgi:hypothetical protein